MLQKEGNGRDLVSVASYVLRKSQVRLGQHKDLGHFHQRLTHFKYLECYNGCGYV